MFPQYLWQRRQVSPKPAATFFFHSFLFPRISRFRFLQTVAVTEVQIPSSLKRLLEISNLTDLLLISYRHSYLDTGKGLEKTANPFDSEAEFSQAIMQLAFDAGARLDQAKPISDFMIGNYRFHAVLQSAISEFNQLSVRKHPTSKVLLKHLQQVGMFDELQQKMLETIISNNENFLIFGATGSGKTTLLSAMLQETNQRIVAIEQIPELTLSPPSVTLLERKANIEGAGEISTNDLLIEALRMRPDRVLVGEVRGAELATLLQAMNNGHRGSGATIHADRFEEIPNRLLMLGQFAGLAESLTARLCAGAIDWVVQLSKTPNRHISDIGKLELINSELVLKSWSPNV